MKKHTLTRISEEALTSLPELNELLTCLIKL